MGWWASLWVKRAEEWTYVEFGADQVPAGGERTDITPNSGYLNVTLVSLHVRDVRRGLVTFYGAVHSWISVPSLTGQPALFQVLTTPEKLKGVDPNKLDRVITLNKRLLGPVPYRGGDVELQVGLFSIKGENLAGPFLGLLQQMSDKAGVSYLQAALPFAGLLTSGIGLLAGADSDSILEIGLSQTLARPRTGYYAVVRAPRDRLDVTRLRVAPDGKLTDLDGRAIADYPYFVIHVEATSIREAWFEVPELQGVYAELNAAVRAGKVEEAKALLAIFGRTVLTSPDLLAADARQLVAKVTQETNDILSPVALTGGRPNRGLPPLRSIDPFTRLGGDGT